MYLNFDVKRFKKYSFFYRTSQNTLNLAFLPILLILGKHLKKVWLSDQLFVFVYESSVTNDSTKTVGSISQFSIKH